MDILYENVFIFNMLDFSAYKVDLKKLFVSNINASLTDIIFYVSLKVKIQL